MLRNISLGTAISEKVVLPNDTNHYCTIFGGTLLAWMDSTTFIAARKYAGNDVVTVSVDNVVFRSPLNVGDIVKISSHITLIGNTSIEVCVNVTSDKRKIIENAYFTFVNVDKDGKSLPVVQPSFETKEEKEIYDMRKKQKECKKQAERQCLISP